MARNVSEKCVHVILSSFNTDTTGVNISADGGISVCRDASERRSAVFKVPMEGLSLCATTSIVDLCDQLSSVKTGILDVTACNCFQHIDVDLFNIILVPRHL